MLQGLGRDFAFAARRLLATPMFTGFAILSLAFGVGVTTAVYSVVDSIFWTSSVLWVCGFSQDGASTTTTRGHQPSWSL